MPLPDGPGPWLRRDALLLLAACGVAAVFWRLGAPARAATTSMPTRTGPVLTFGGPPRPPRVLRLAWGSPEGRATLRAGFAPSEPTRLPACIDLTGERGSFEVSLAPDPVGMELVVLGRGTSPGESRLNVRVNEVSAGALTLGRELLLHHLAVPTGLWVAGVNRIDLVPAPGATGTVSLAAAWLLPTSATTWIELGAPGAEGQLRGGFSGPTQWDGRSIRRVRALATIEAKLNPLPTDYSMVISARASAPVSKALEVGVSLDRSHLGELGFGNEWHAGFLPVSLAQLPHSTQQLELLLTQAQESDLAVERVGLVPQMDETLIDVGHDHTRAYLTSGFSFDEASAGRDGAWSDGLTSRVTAVLRPLDQTYVLAIAGSAFHPLAPLSVRVAVNGEAVGTINVGAEAAIYELPVRRLLLWPGTTDITFDFGRTLAPAQAEPGATDRRELGVFFDWLELRPASRGAPLTTVAEP